MIFRLKYINKNLVWLPGTGKYPNPSSNDSIKPALCEGNMEICGLKTIHYDPGKNLIRDDTALEGIVFRCCPSSKIRKF